MKGWVGLGRRGHGNACMLSAAKKRGSHGVQALKTVIPVFYLRNPEALPPNIAAPDRHLFAPSLTRRQQLRVGVYGGDGAHALEDERGAYGVAGVGPPQRLRHHRVHVLGGGAVAGAQHSQYLEQLDL